MGNYSVTPVNYYLKLLKWMMANNVWNYHKDLKLFNQPLWQG